VAKPKVALPILVEGRYDKIKLSSIVDANILTTEGFSIFHDKEKLALLRRLAKDGGIIVLTDPDGGGRQIRSFLSGALGTARIHHLHIPAVHGKEKRKKQAGRSGLLGVEGADPEVLTRLLSPFYTDTRPSRASLTKADLFADGLLGGDMSAERRASLSSRLGLPADLSSNALLSAINLLFSEEEYRAALSEVTP
jgi:ribonuclease M5